MSKAIVKFSSYFYSIKPRAKKSLALLNDWKMDG